MRILKTYAVSLTSHSPYVALLPLPRMEWMHLLTNALHIPFFALGTPFMFNPNLVPRFSEASRIVNSWAGEILYSDPTEGLHSISSPEMRSRALPCAALLHYMLDILRDRAHTTSVVAPLWTWYSYGPAYRNHRQRLREYIKADAQARVKMPGALLYLR